MTSALKFALALFCFWQPVAAAPRWIAVTSAHVEMYTTNSEKDARRALQVLEGVRAFFAEQDESRERVTVIAFSSPAEYQDYRIHKGAVAYYLQNRGRDLIILQDIQPDHLRVAVHEYTHLVIRHAGLTLPTWLNEGVADVYSSLERGMGASLPERMQALQRQPLLPWSRLFSMDDASPSYGERHEMSVFYAQSWIAVHLLMLSPEYGSRFPGFLQAAAKGVPAIEALRSIYGKSLDQFNAAVEEYRKHEPSAAGSDALTCPDIPTSVRELTPLEVRLALAEVLSFDIQSLAEARKRLLELAAQYPANSEVEEALGYFAWQHGQPLEAVAYFRQAIQHGSRSATMMYRCAELEHRAGADAESVVQLLSTAIRLQPDYSDARIALGQLEAERGHYKAALLAIAPIKSVGTDQAYRLYSLAAYSHASLKNQTSARAAAAKALEFASTREERSQVEDLLASLGS